MGVAAMYFGGANPVLTTPAVCSLDFQIPSVPVSRHMAFHPKVRSDDAVYRTIAVLAISMIAKISANKKRESSPACGKPMMKKDKNTIRRT